MKIDNEFEAWAKEVRNTLGPDADPIDRSVLQYMYDDGLEPGDVADLEIRGRYPASKPRKKGSDNLSDRFTSNQD